MKLIVSILCLEMNSLTFVFYCCTYGYVKILKNVLENKCVTVEIVWTC